MFPKRILALSCIYALLIASLAFPAEVRKLGSNDLEWATGGTGAAETTVSSGGKTVTKIDATHIKLRSGSSPLSVESALSAWVDVRAYDTEQHAIDNAANKLMLGGSINGRLMPLRIGGQDNVSSRTWTLDTYYQGSGTSAPLRDHMMVFGWNIDRNVLDVAGYPAHFLAFETIYNGYTEWHFDTLQSDGVTNRRSMQGMVNTASPYDVKNFIWGWTQFYDSTNTNLVFGIADNGAIAAYRNFRLDTNNSIAFQQLAADNVTHVNLGKLDLYNLWQMGDAGYPFVFKDNVLVGNPNTFTAPHSTLEVNGSFARRVDEVSDNTTLGMAHSFVTVYADAGPKTITLPNATSIQGREYIIKKRDSSGNAVTVAHGGNYIDGAATYSLATQWKYVHVIACMAGNFWCVMGNN